MLFSMFWLFYRCLLCEIGSASCQNKIFWGDRNLQIYFMGMRKKRSSDSVQRWLRNCWNGEGWPCESCFTIFNKESWVSPKIFVMQNRSRGPMDALVIVLKAVYICNTLDVFKTRKVCKLARELVLSFPPVCSHWKLVCLEDPCLLVLVVHLWNLSFRFFSLLCSL